MKKKFNHLMLNADYECSGIWVAIPSAKNAPFLHYFLTETSVDYEDLELPEKLIEEIKNWLRPYNEKYKYWEEESRKKFDYISFNKIGERLAYELHEFLTFDSFKRGNRCKDCRTRSNILKFTFSQETVVKKFAEHGCELLGKYVKAAIPVEFKCKCGNISKISLNNFNKVHRCTNCSGTNKGWNFRSNFRLENRTLKITHEKVKKFFEECSCELLGAYINKNSLLKFRCKCENISNIKFNSFKKSRCCKKCGIASRSGVNHYEWQEDRKQLKENYDFRQKCYKMLGNSLKATSGEKRNRTHVMLGYRAEDLQKHIKSHPCWSNVKEQKWHLDHIFPIQAFVDYGIKDLKIINSLDNLRPLLAFENISKSDEYNISEFKDWLERKGVKICQLQE